MKKQVKDAFHVSELLLLSSAFHAHGLFGLPDKQTFQLKGKRLFTDIYKDLIQKEVLSPKGKITPGGAYVIKALEYYYHSKKYVRIHNLMIAFREKKEEEVIVLMELDKEQYRLLVMSKLKLLKLLMNRFPVLLREPDEAEKAFHKRELNKEETAKVKQHDIDDTVFNFEYFYIAHNDVSDYGQWFAFEHDNQLMMIETEKQSYYYYSQYRFLKKLFDKLDFPYKEGDEIDGR